MSGRAFQGDRGALVGSRAGGPPGGERRVLAHPPVGFSEQPIGLGWRKRGQRVAGAGEIAGAASVCERTGGPEPFLSRSAERAEEAQADLFPHPAKLL